jgi:hypothetical protein
VETHGASLNPKHAVAPCGGASLRIMPGESGSLAAGGASNPCHRIREASRRAIHSPGWTRQRGRGPVHFGLRRGGKDTVSIGGAGDRVKEVAALGRLEPAPGAGQHAILGRRQGQGRPWGPMVIHEQRLGVTGVGGVGFWSRLRRPYRTAPDLLRGEVCFSERGRFTRRAEHRGLGFWEHCCFRDQDWQSRPLLRRNPLGIDISRGGDAPQADFSAVSGSRSKKKFFSRGLRVRGARERARCLSWRVARSPLYPTATTTRIT